MSSRRSTCCGVLPACTACASCRGPRALLARGLVEHQVWALRHSLVCAPLASEILSSCMHVEAQIRTELHGKGEMRLPSDETQRFYQAFANGTSETTVYPIAHPSRPDQAQDVWAFCSFGETLTLGPPLNKEPLSAYRKIKDLRNSIAHGHYVCWAHVKQAAKAAKRFANQ